MTGFAMGLAFLLDLIIGDPPSWPHPVRIMGAAITRLENLVRRSASSPGSLRAGGVLIAVAVAGGTWLIAWFILAVSSALVPALGVILGVAMAYTCLAARSLYDQTWRVLLALRRDDLPEARRFLGMVVGRETAQLERPDILRAVLETIAENLSDGVIAPMFYMALGGPALGLAYKAVNTMDSMLGYKNEAYLHLGWAPARLDDVANFIPARLTAALIVAAAWLLRLDAKGALDTWLKHGGRHSSPNSGRPEAAMAGALGVSLGGPSVYYGTIVDKPTIGWGGAPFEDVHVIRAERILFVSSGLMLILILIVRGVW